MELRNEIDRRRILELMARIEGEGPQTFEDRFPQLTKDIWAALESGKNLSFVVARLTRILEEVSK